MIISSGRFLRFTIFFMGFFLLCGCDRVNTEWHKYDQRQLEISGDSSAASMRVASDGWRIFGQTDDPKIYEWGWEITISNMNKVEQQINPPAPKNSENSLGNPRQHKNISIEETLEAIRKEERERAKNRRDITITYVLLDQDGFKLVEDSIKEVSSFGTTQTYRHTSTMPGFRALRASKSQYQINTH